MKSGTKDVLAVLETIFLVSIFFLMFAPFIKVDDSLLGYYEDGYSVNGYGVIFGNHDKGFAFSTFGLITFICLVVAILLSIFKLFIVDKDNRTIINVIMILLGLLAGIFFFCMKTSMMVEFDQDIKDALNYLGMEKSQLLEFYDLGVGAIISGILAILATGLAVIEQLVKTTK